MDDNRIEEEIFSFSDGGVVPEKVEKPQQEENENSKYEKEENEPQEKKKKSLGKRLLKGFLIFMCVFLSLVLVLAGSATIFIFSKLGKITYDTEEKVEIDPNQEFVIPEGEENIDFATIGDAAGNSMREIIKNWATNEGEKMWQKNVLNFLLIGSDASVNSSWRAHSMDKGNTDAMILVSIDRNNKTIKLVSFMRDSYTYMDQFDRYAKLNAACANGGPGYLVETIENDYKIEIDGYVLVDFDSFVQVIDIVGGVRVNVPAYVGESLNKGDCKKNPIPIGNNVLIDGEQALHFSRVRKTDADGDISRTRRQREVINALIQKCKGASLGEINAVADAVLANVRTNISRKTILTYAAKAVTDNWASYTLTQTEMPEQNIASRIRSVGTSHPALT